MTDDIETLRRGNERLQVALAEANAVREACAQRAFRLEAEVERLREEIAALREKDERLRDALKVCLVHWLRDDNPDELQEDVARLKEFCHWEAALRREGK